MQKTYIENLEQYMIHTTGSPDRLHQTTPTVSGVRTTPTPSLVFVAGQSSPSQGTKRDYDGTPRTDEAASLRASASLVEHNKQTTYIEACVLPLHLCGSQIADVPTLQTRVV